MVIQLSATSLPGLAGRALSLLSHTDMGRNRAPLCGPSQALGKAGKGVSTEKCVRTTKSYGESSPADSPFCLRRQAFYLPPSVELPGEPGQKFT